MPYTFYKGALLTNEEYERVKDELDQKEREYLNLLFGGSLESKEEPGKVPLEGIAGALDGLAEAVEPPVEPVVEPVENQGAHSDSEGSETASSEESGEPEVRPNRRRRQK